MLRSLSGMLDCDVGTHRIAEKPLKKIVLVALTVGLCFQAFAASVITARLDDPKAVYVDVPGADADSSAALQSAVDKAAGVGREGIVFVPAGRYALTHTLFLWPG